MEKIKRFFNGNQSAKGASVILIITLALSNLLGLFRDHYLAQKIPTTILDTYYAAFRLPDLIFNLLFLGAIAAAFIPVFTGFIAKKREKEAWHVVNAFLSISVIALIIISVLLFFTMPFFIRLLVPDFTPEKHDLTIELARVMLASPLFFGISYIIGGILNSFKRFVVFSIAPLIYNLSIIVFTVLLSDKIGVWAPVFGVIAGAFLHMLVQIPTAFSLGWKPKFVLDAKNPSVRKIFYLMVPRSIGLGATQLMLVAYTAIASTLGAGAVAIFNLADNIQTMPIVVFGASFATAIFPHLAESASLGKNEDFVASLWRTIRVIVFILVPFGIAMILFRAQIVRLILGSGHFGWSQTIATANTLGYFAIALVFQGLVNLFARAFYAMHDSKSPAAISIISVVISVVLGLIFSKILGVEGLALAFSLAGFFNASVLYFLLRKKIPIFRNQEKEVLIFCIKIIIATVFMAVSVQFAKDLLGVFVNMQKYWGVLAQMFGASVIGIAVYFVLSRLLKVNESKEILELFKLKFKL